MRWANFNDITRVNEFVNSCEAPQSAVLTHLVTLFVIQGGDCLLISMASGCVCKAYKEGHFVLILNFIQNVAGIKQGRMKVKFRILAAEFKRES